MKLLAKIVVVVVINAVGLYAAAYIPGFTLTGGIGEILGMAAILTVLNFFLKPLLTLVLGPVIIITLGLGLILVNALILKILDIVSNNLTIDTIPALLYATVLIGVTNFVFHLATKK